MTQQRYTVGAGALARTLVVDDGALRTVELAGLPVESSSELELVLDAARFRHDVDGWRYARGRHEGFERDGFDDSSWQTVPHLHPIYDVRYEGYACFRARFRLPEGERGQPVSLVLGGLDDEDWSRYAVFLDGNRVDEWEGAGRWREPRRIELAPGDPRYDGLCFGGESLLAVETRDLDRRDPAMPPGEDEHFFFVGWLVDQFVCTGRPYRVVRDLEVASVREGAALEVDLRGGGFAATIAYESADGVLRKRVAIRNEGGEEVRLLDVLLEDLRGPFPEPSKGGQGRPVLAGGRFYGIEHTAGLAQGDEGRIRALLMPGVALAPGATYACAPAVAGESFHDYLLGLRERRSTRLTIYDTLGWTDYASELPERPRLTEELFEESLERLRELRAAGAAFDLYALDDWWDPADFMVFNRDQYPRGGAHLAARLREEGMGVTLWSATTQAAWTSSAVPGLEPSIAGGVARGLGWHTDPAALGAWDWDVVFAYVATGQMRYCWASEPFRGHLRASLAKHVADTDARALKLDCTVLHCTSSEHDYLPGRHSVHAIHDSVLRVVEGIGRPELFVIWYWGFQSPWWLAHGDLLFDKALKLEAASPASTPAPSWRAGVTLNSDQAVRHASLVPLALQDSLGVWLGDVPWANWMGAGGWHDAFVLDVARGSTVVSLWGDLWLLEDDDLELLAGALELVRETEPGFRETAQIGGDPWRGEPYGYVQPLADGKLVTVANPGFEPRSLGLDLGAAWEIYPSPGAVAAGELELLPWEVRVLRSVASPDGLPPRPSPRPRPARTLGDGVRLPALAEGDRLLVWARVSRGGSWRYDPEPQSLFRLDLRVGGEPVETTRAPAIRSWNGPGCPWVTFSAPARPDWSGQELSVSLAAELPPGYEAESGVLAYDGRALDRRRRLALRPALVAPRI